MSPSSIALTIHGIEESRFRWQMHKFRGDSTFDHGSEWQ